MEGADTMNWTFNLNEARSFIERLVSENPSILEQILGGAQHHPDQQLALNQEFLDKLDRIDKEKLSNDESCPICANSYLDDQYPLVVSLPCPGRHRFDLECVGPWLLKHNTCPMCRYDVSKRTPVVVEDSEEEYDDMYG